MRITKLDIRNFRGLYGPHTIDLGSRGKNLMLYGENGSGKSSLCYALKVFFEASVIEANMAQHKNIFVSGNPDEDVHIKVTFNDKGTTTELVIDKDNKKNPQQYLIEANKIKGFLGYKNLLRTHYLTSDHVNLFDLLMDDLFMDTPDPVSGHSRIINTWNTLQRYIKTRRNSWAYKSCPQMLSALNTSLKTLLDNVQIKANEIIRQFDCGIQLSFQFSGISMIEASRICERCFGKKEIILQVDFHQGSRISEHHHFLNEGRLTAIAIAIYFASILIMPQQTLYKILVLDDILVGLDTSNRLPLLDILKKHFSDYQIIMATYDRQWYEVVKSTLGEGEWHYAEMYVTKDHQNGFEIPVIKNGDFIQIAKDYIAAGDFKASAVYIRSAFEQTLVNYCISHRTPVCFQIRPEKIKAETFWQSVKTHDQRQTQPMLGATMIKNIETKRTLVMNPFSHYDILNPQFRAELQATITAVEQLKNALG